MCISYGIKSMNHIQFEINTTLIGITSLILEKTSKGILEKYLDTFKGIEQIKM